MVRVGLNAHLLSLQASYRGAGVSRYIERLLFHLPQVDASAQYVAFTGDARVRYPGWDIVTSRMRTDSPPRRILWEQAIQPWSVRRQRLHLLHAPVYVGPLLVSCPQVVTLHDLSFYLYPELFRPSRRVYLQRMTRITVGRAAGVIADSESTRQDAMRVLGLSREKVVVVPAGVGQEMHPIEDGPGQCAQRQLLQRHQLDQPIILFVGTLEPRKNIATLLEAFALLVQKHGLPHHLVIGGGKGWYYEAIFQRVEQLRLEELVRFVGYVPQEELPLWYNLAEVFVYPSLYEGFGLPPLEAMACGTPVVVSNTSALPEVVGDAGVTVEPHDPEALAQAILELAEDPGRRRAMSRAGLERARGFSWQNTARLTARYYHEILGEGDGRHV